ncbi:hypothetical protein CANARDRAFT_24213 [[Candida] arabinofermentans NRRL YB-2248]|uniref:F-box domain-containing protein n=1 Tax=[Candida] arabinofermentans NRRL YB-2248 TaxID=983967 RepID=A0A1E4SXA3_9ASCO|nr:hypothetical protein CANARDRAFT_24213 [[Candida] arabinofermentans NRRL YB-2248]
MFSVVSKLLMLLLWCDVQAMDGGVRNGSGYRKKKGRFRRNKGKRKPFIPALIPENTPRLIQGSSESFKIGSTDLTFNDTQYTQLYNYNRMKPWFYENYSLPNSKVRSLKEIASLKVAKLANSLTKQHFSSTSMSWTVCNKIWEFILLMEQDTPFVFQLFASRFGDEKSFKCHYIPNVYKITDFSGNYNRNFYIHQHSITNKHRFETFGCNISFDNLILEINNFKFNNVVILNLNKINIKNSYLQLNRMVNLTYLNVSDTSLTDAMLKSWCISISSGKLSNLKCLVLSHNEQLTDITPVMKLEQGSLQYVETTLSPPQHKNWEMIDNIPLVNLSDSRKMKYLAAKKYIDYDKDSFILDYKLDTSQVINEEINGLNDDLGHHWDGRFLEKNVNRNIRSLIRIEREQDTIIVEDKQPVRKKLKKTIKMNVNKFFDL